MAQQYKYKKHIQTLDDIGENIKLIDTATYTRFINTIKSANIESNTFGNENKNELCDLLNKIYNKKMKNISADNLELIQGILSIYGIIYENIKLKDLFKNIKETDIKKYTLKDETNDEYINFKDLEYLLFLLIYILNFINDIFDNIFTNESFLYIFINLIIILSRITLISSEITIDSSIEINISIDGIINNILINELQKSYIWEIDPLNDYNKEKYEEIKKNINSIIKDPSNNRYYSGHTFTEFELFNIIYYLTDKFKKKNNQFKIKGELPVIIFENVFKFFKDKNYDIYLIYIIRGFHLLLELYVNKELDKFIIYFRNKLLNLKIADSIDKKIRLLHIYIKYLLLRNIIYSFGNKNKLLNKMINLFLETNLDEVAFIITYLNEIHLDNEILVNTSIYNLKAKKDIVIFFDDEDEDTVQFTFDSKLSGLSSQASISQGSTSPGSTSKSLSSQGSTSPGSTSQGSTSPGSTSPGSTSPGSTSKSLSSQASISQALSSQGLNRVGLENCGESCFLNSILQLLYTMTPMQNIKTITMIPEASVPEALVSTLSYEKQDLRKAYYRVFHLKAILDLLKAGEESGNGIRILSSIMRSHLVPMFKGLWAPGRPEDANEFLALILEAIKELNQTELNILLKSYSFFIIDKSRCSTTFKVKTKDLNYTIKKKILQLPEPLKLELENITYSPEEIQPIMKGTPTSVQELIDNYLTEEEQEPPNLLAYCTDGQSFKTNQLNIPDDVKYIIISLNRKKPAINSLTQEYIIDDDTNDFLTIKLSTVVNINPKISIPSYSQSDSSKLKEETYKDENEEKSKTKITKIDFICQGAIIHKGTAKSGHYYYVLYDETGTRVIKSFDDDHVYTGYDTYAHNEHGATLDPIDENAFVLLYRRVEPSLVQPGGTINTISRENTWKNKYLKYKQKYLNLAKEI